jgi:hypothetical protein
MIFGYASEIVARTQSEKTVNLICRGGCMLRAPRRKVGEE